MDVRETQVQQNLLGENREDQTMDRMGYLIDFKGRNIVLWEGIQYMFIAYVL